MLKLGKKSIKSLYYGDKAISKAYLGEKLVFNKITKPYYCEVEYLESTGTQYIDTGIKPNQNTKVELKIYNPTDFNVTKTGSILFGARQGSDNYPTYTVISNILNKYGTRWDYGSKIIETLDYPLTVGEHIVVKDKQYNYLDGNLVATNIIETFSLDFTMHLFGTNTRGTNTLPFVGKIYYCKIFESNVLIRDYIPVLDFNMKPCMYDKVSGKFFYNQGSGEFLYGREIHEVEYIESDGNQYIDTEYNINIDTDEVELNYQLLDETVYKWLFGEHDNSARFGLGSGDGTNKRNLAYGSNTIKLIDSYFFDNKHNFKANKEGVFVDRIKFTDYKSFTSTSSIWLFGLNLSPYTYGSKTRIWGYKHKRNGSFIRNYIPAIDENGKAFMFDKVSHTIFDNDGTGEFLYEKPESPSEPITLIGNTKIENGILSGFDENSYAIVNYTLPNDLMQHEFEIVFDFTTQAVISPRQSIFDTNADDKDNGYWIAHNQNAFWFNYRKDGVEPTSKNINGRPIRQRENYTIKFSNKGVSTPTFYEKSTSYKDWSGKAAFNEDVVHGKFALGKYPAKYSLAKGGETTRQLYATFNLANCYIEIDGVKVWEGVKNG